MHETRHVGRFEVTAIVDADIPDEPIVDAFPGLSASDLAAAKAGFAGVYTDDDRWRLRVRAWVVRHDSGTLLLDTGLGGEASPAREWTSETGALAAALGELGISTGTFGTVVISHVHDDHIGGILDDDAALIFTNARYLIQRSDVEWQRAESGASEYAKRAWRPIGLIEDAGRLDAIEGDHTLSPGVSVRLMPGHTPGHQVVILENDGDRMLLSADTWNHPLQFAQPDGASGSDADPEGAAVSRRALLDDLGAHPETVVAPSHLAEAFGTVRRTGDAWGWSPL